MNPLARYDVYGYLTLVIAALAAVTAVPLADAKDVEFTIPTDNDPPVIEPIYHMNVTAGHRITFQVEAHDDLTFDGGIRYFLLGQLPPGVVNSSEILDRKTGKFDWRPNRNQVGTHYLTVGAWDGYIPDRSGHATPQSFFMNVLDNPPPVVEPIGDIIAYEDMPITFNVNATDTDRINHTLEYYINQPLPSGVNDGRELIDKRTGHFSWTPVKDHIGVHTLTLLVWDGQQRPDGRTYLNFTITVLPNPPPVVEPIDDITVSVGQEAFFQVHATDVATEDSRGLNYILLDPLPPGEDNTNDMLNWRSGFFRWTPDDNQRGVHTFNLRVWDGQWRPDGRTDLNFNIAVDGQVLTGFPTGITIPEHEEYIFDVDFVAGISSHTFRLENEPDGASIDPATGVFSWTPSEDQDGQDYTFTVIAADGDGQTAESQTATITVAEANPAPVIEPIDDITVSPGQTVSFNVNATDIENYGYLLYYIGPDLPPGVTDGESILDKRTGHFNWTTSETGTYPLTLMVWDGQQPRPHGRTFLNFTITVGENTPPSVEPIDDINADPGQTVSFNVTATDATTGGDLQYTLVPPLPPGVRDGADILDPDTGHFSWLAGEPGVYHFALRVWDGLPGNAGYAHQSFTITVGENPALSVEPIDDIEVDPGQTVSFYVNASDMDTAGSLQYTLVPPLPPGVRDGGDILDQDTGHFSWLAVESGAHHFALRVWDGLPGSAGYAQENFTVTVRENPPPVIEPIDDIVVTVGQRISFYVNATDTHTLGSLRYVLLDPMPPTVGYSHYLLNRDTGYFDWTPAWNQKGIHTIKLRVWDGLPGDNGRAHLNFTITVNGQVLAGVPTRITIPEHKEYTFDADFVEGVSDHTFGLRDAPGGARIDPVTGVFSWTPSKEQGGSGTVPRSYSFTVTAVNGDGATVDSQPVSIWVLHVNPPPVIDPIDDIVVSTGERISFYINATDKDTVGGLRHVLDPPLPSGVSDSSDILNRGTGHFDWTPRYDQAGIHPINLRVWDGQPGNAGYAHESFTITVNGEVLTAVPTGTTIPEHKEYTFDANLVQGVNYPDHTFGLLDAPAGAAINPATGVFSWTPSEDQGGKSYTFRVVVGDGDVVYMIGYQDVTIMVTEYNPLPVVEPIDDITVYAGATVSFNVSATDIDTDGDLRYIVLDPLPPGVRDSRDILDRTTGHFSWTPREIDTGVHPINLVVWDGQSDGGGETHQSFNITIVQESNPPVVKPIDDIIVSVDEEITFYVNATDTHTIGGLRYYVINPLPPSVSDSSDILNRSTGYFSWTPSESQAGIHPITVRVWDGQPRHLGRADVSFTITVKGPILEPLPSSVTIPEHERYTFVARLAEGVDLPGHTFSITGGPDGSKIDPATGRFIWAPSEDQGGNTYSIVIGVLNDSGITVVNHTIRITVIEDNPSPTIESIDGTTVHPGQTISFNVSATDIDTVGTGLHYVLDPPLPPGVSDSSEILDRVTGQFTWTPNENQTGTHIFHLRVWDGQLDNRGNTRQSFNIAVIPLDAWLQILLPNINRVIDEDTALIVTPPLNSPDGSPAIITEATTDMGGTTNHTATTITYTPAPDFNGWDSVEYIVTYDGNRTAGGLIQVFVAPVNDLPVISGLENMTINELELLDIPIIVGDVESAADRLILTAEFMGEPGLPEGMEMTRESLRWTPTELQGPGEYPLTVTVSDGMNQTTSEVTFTVEETNQNPVFVSVPAQSVTVGETLTVQINATDADIPAQTLSYDILGDDHGAVLVNTTSSGTTLSWTPNSTHIPRQTITIFVQDDFTPNGSARLPISIAVAEPDAVNTSPVADDFSITVAPLETVPTDLAAGGHIHDAEQSATTLVVTVNDTPAKGNATASGTTITYTANADAVGTDEVSYTVTDDGDLTATGMMTVRIEVPDEPMNPPRAPDEYANTAEDMEVTVRPDISDPDGGAVSITAVTNGTNGRADHTATTVTYRPNRDFNGDDTVTYTVANDGGLTATGMINITVTPVNDPPVIGALRNWNINATELFTLKIEARDVDGDPLMFNLTEGPEKATLNQQGFFLWRPTNDDIMDHNVTITVSDGRGGVDTETITITVLPAGQATGQPPALDPIGDRTVSEGQTLQIRPRAEDPDGGLLTYSLDRGTLPDAATFDNTTGHLDWTPGESDGDTSHNITITVSDGRGGTDSESITITVRETNQNPTTTLVSQQTAVVGQQITVRIMANDTDIPPQTLSYNITGNDLGASISGNVLTWTPNPTHVGSQSITVLVEDDYDPKGSATVVIPITVSSTGINHDPVAPDILVNAGLSSPSVIEPAVTDPDGDSVTIAVLTEPALGTIDASSLASGIIIYTPNQTGIERIDYEASDGRGGSDTGTITVFINEAGNARPELATIHDRGARVGENLDFVAVATDDDDTALTFGAANVPAGATMDAATGSFDWTPTPSQNGSHTVTIFIHDDSGGADWQDVVITVLRADEINLPPVPENVTADAIIGVLKAIQPRITDPEGDPTTIIAVSETELGSVTDAFLSSGLVVYLGGELGSEDITYTVSDGRGGIANATISITVAEPANVNPILDFIGDKVVIAGENLSFDVMAIDIDGFVSGFDLDGVVPVGASISPFGTFNWMPTGDQVGTYDLTIIVFDDADGNDTETISVIVRPVGFVNSAPSAPDVIIATSQGIPDIARPVLTDPDDDPVIISETGPTTKGRILSGFLRAGIIIYQPGPGQTGTETTSYTAFDGSNGMDTAAITIFINENGNGLPVLESIDHRNINVGQTLTFDVTATDPDGDALSYLLVGASENAEISAQGGFSWTPAAADEGNHTITIVAYDEQGGSDAQVASIRVLPAGTANTPPVAPSTAITVAQGAAIVITPEISDPDGDTVLITDAVSDGDGLIIQSDDRIDYIHISTAPTETITYTVTDARGAVSTGTITITVR